MRTPALMLTLFFFVTLGCTNSGIHGLQQTETCASHLKQILYLLREATPAEPCFPGSLADLDGLTTNAFVFVCPSTGHKAGQIKAVEAWTDYIYVANVEDIEAVPTAIVICPPKNHGGRWGYVGFNDGTVERVAASEVKELVAKPWSRSKVATQSDIARMQQRVKIVLPKRKDFSLE